MSLLTDDRPEDAQHLTRSTKMGDCGGMKTRQANGEEEMVRSAMLEPSTLQWPAERHTDGQTVGQTGKGDRMSVRSDTSLREAASWTESQRELMAVGERGGGGGGTGADEGAGLRTHLEEDEPAENHLPEKAAQVFSPAVTVINSPSSPRESEAFWEMESEKSPFLGHRGAPMDYNQHGYQYEWTEDTRPATCKYTCPHFLISYFTSYLTSFLLTSYFPLLTSSHPTSPPLFLTS